MKKTSLLIAALAFAFVLPGFGAARATEPPAATVTAPQHKKDRGDFLIAVKIGALFPQAFSKLETSYLVDLELGWALPVLKHRLAISLDGAFTDPQADGQTTDPRLDASGGSYTWHLEQRELMFGLTLWYRHPIGRFIPYIGAGPRLFLLESRVRGQAGSAGIITSSEESTKIGAGIPLGFGVTVGPGHLFAEVALNIAPIDHRTTGDDNTGSLSLSLGYRLVF
ncbi:MAG: hypothetical protein ACHQ17_02865 [Polyangia bacterium]|jgi:hypothetical protein